MDSQRIYHPWDRWEDYPAGFYENLSGNEKVEKIQAVLEMFSSPAVTEHYMRRVISEWPNSCEHNLTNSSMNRIAYLGQAACCLYGGVPSTVTMEAWSQLDKSLQDRADAIAGKILQEWLINHTTHA